MKADDLSGFSGDLLLIKEALKSDNIYEIKIYYITNNELERESLQNEYQSFSDKISKFNKPLKSFYFDIIGFENFKNISLSTLLELPKEIRNKQVKFLLDSYFENKEKNTLVSEMKIKDLAKIIHENKKFIFFSNIRNYLGSNTVNKKIEKTFHNQPKDFWFYNNGITIVCREYYDRNNGIYDVVAPQIVNGCQTSSTIESCFYSLSTENRNNQEGTILVKIIKDTNESKRKKITEYTNSQTSVTGKDFFALQTFHKELQNEFKKIGYDYEIQRNVKAYNYNKFQGKREYNHLFDTKFKTKNSFPAKDVTQYFICAFHQNPAKAKNIGNYMPGGSYYSSIFNENTPLDPRYYIFPYAVYNTLKNTSDIPKKIEIDKWKTSLLFMVHIFFLSVKVKMDKNNFEEIKSFSSEYMDELNKIFISETDYKNHINTVKEIIVDFYKDSTIIKKISDNLPKFMKNTIESDSEVKGIIIDKIKDNLED